MNLSDITSSDPVRSFSYKDLGIETSDRVVGSGIAVCTIGGLLGNVFAFFYFWSRRQKSIHDMQYLAITTVDLITLLSCTAIVPSLFNQRDPTLFANAFFCTVWSMITMFTARMSMFLAMMICVTRTIAMKFPHHHIKRSHVISAIAAYSSYMVLLYLIFVSQKWNYGKYSHWLSLCKLVSINKRGMPAFALYFVLISLFIELIVPSLVTFVCFVIGTRFLITRPPLNAESDRKFRRVSVTVSMFTAAFLLCNTPCFLYYIFEVIASFNDRVLEFILNSNNFRFYGRLLLQYFVIMLNAAINPILYLSRMRGFQRWIRISRSLPNEGQIGTSGIDSGVRRPNSKHQTEERL